MLVNHVESALFGLFPSQLSYLRIHVVKIEPFTKPLRFNVVVSRAILLLDVGPDNIKISFSMPYKVKHCLNLNGVYNASVHLSIYLMILSY
jgi:hypothetical protein